MFYRNQLEKALAKKLLANDDRGDLDSLSLVNSPEGLLQTSWHLLQTIKISLQTVVILEIYM